MISNAQLHSEWWIYALIAVGYTIIVRALSDNPIFSKRNGKSLSSIIWAHAIFLSVILALTKLAINIYPTLPEWMIHRNRRGSIFVMLCLGLVLLFATVEQPAIYVKSRICEPNLEEPDAEDIDPDEKSS